MQERVWLPAHGLGKLMETEFGNWSVQVKLFVELFTAEVQSNIGKQVFTESKEELAAAQAGLTHGLKV